MSRTKRRRKDKAPDWVYRDYTFNNYYWSWVTITDKDKIKKELARWHSDAGWHGDYGETPGHWIHDFHEVPFRARTRNKLKKILTLDDYEEADVNLTYKKPHIYYW